MIKKLLAFVIIFLFVGASVVSSINAVENEYSSEEILFRGKTAYAYIAYGGSSGEPEGPCYFDLDDPGEMVSLAPTQSAYFLTGGTYSYDYGWFAVEYNTGGLWKIDTETGDMDCIGGGGVGVGDIAWDDCTSMIYGTSGNSFFEIDPENGGQTCIGGSGGISIWGLAFDSNCICYGVGYNGSALNLYTIDFSNLEITFVAPLTNFYPIYYCNAEFDKDIDILYLINGVSLYTCDTETGECTKIGNFEGGAELSALAIPYEYINKPPVTTISFDPPEPDGCNGWYVSNVVVTLNATDLDSDVNVTYYRINGGNWQIIPGGYGNFILSDDGEDILIEYYSVDVDGNAEDIKSATIDIDQTPPWIIVGWDAKKVGWRRWKISFTLSVTDNTSGVDRVDIYINDVLQEVITGPGPVYGWSIIINGGLHINFKFVAWDNACNQAIVVVNSYEINFESIIKNQNHFNIFLQILRQLRENLYDKLTALTIFSKSSLFNAG